MDYVTVHDVSQSWYARLDTPEKREWVGKMFEKFGIKPPDDL